MRWHENLDGRIAEEFHHMLRTSMGRSVAVDLLAHAIDFMATDEYGEPEILRRARNVAREAAFRRSAVGFCLPDIVFTGLAFRQALEKTVLNNFVRSNEAGDGELIAGLMALNRLGDAIVSGEIAGYFSFREYHNTDEDRGVA